MLGEFGFLIAEQPGRSGESQFLVLLQHFAVMSEPTKYQMLTTFAKLANLYEDVRPHVTPFLERHRASADIEIQQRAIEYHALGSMAADMVETVLQVCLSVCL